MEDLPATDDREAPQTVAMEGAAQLIDLPDELILPILEALCRHCDGRNGWTFQAERDNHKALVSFSKTCFRFHKLARPYLFHHVCINYDYLEIREYPWQGLKHEYAMFRLMRTLAGNHAPDPDALKAASKRSLANGIDDLATSIKHLEANLTPTLHIDSGKIGKKGPRGDAVGFVWLPEILNRATNLEHLELHIELPLIKHPGFIWTMDQYGRDRYDSVKTPSLICRADCYDKIGKFDLRDTHMIFNRCRNLTTLEIHGIGGMGERFSDTIHVTSQLKTLRLTNCYLRTSDFVILIAGINNLESFTLGRGELRRFQLIGEHGNYSRDTINRQIFPRNVISGLEDMCSHSLRHLELGPFEMKMWECIWHLDPSGTQAENLGYIQTATIHTLRSFEKLEHVQLAQDSILGVPNTWTSRYTTIPEVWPGDIPTEERLDLRRIDTSVPDPDGTRLVDMLPRTLKSLRLTHVNNKLAQSLLTFATAVTVGEFPELKEVSLHGQDPLMERCRYGSRFQIELLLALERHWEFLKKDVLEKMKDLLEGVGVKFSWEAMESNRPAEGWPGNPMLQSLDLQPTPPMTEEEIAFKKFSKQRRDRSIRMQRQYMKLLSADPEEDDDLVLTLPLPSGGELHLNTSEFLREELTRSEQNEDGNELD